MTIEEYAKKEGSNKRKEKALFYILKRLDQDSYETFKKISDKRITNLNYEELIKELNNQSEAYKSVDEAFNYLYSLEKENKSDKELRVWLLSLCYATITVLVFRISIILGLIDTYLSIKNINRFKTSEDKAINKVLNQFDKDILNRTKITIDNSKRQLRGRINRLPKINEEQLDLYTDFYLSIFLNDDYTMENLYEIPEPIHIKMVEKLQQYLNTDETSLEELLYSAIEKKDNIKLIFIKDFEQNKNSN